jgi:hypothetical protein
MPPQHRYDLSHARIQPLHRPRAQNQKTQQTTRETRPPLAASNAASTPPGSRAQHRPPHKVSLPLLYLLFTTIPDVFQNTYGFEIQYTGLAYLGLGLGMFLALGVVMKFNDRTVLHMRNK